ncbi:MAG: hypothetical protein LBR80_16000, partial [Deltaproteobacteria bacterium]|nr:hypothetical protein [Deltaproteobacteria bacterium]
GDGGEGYVRFALVENVQRIKQATRGIKKALSLPPAKIARAERKAHASPAETVPETSRKPESPDTGMEAEDTAPSKAAGSR